METKLSVKNCNKDVHWLKMLKEHELSVVALQPSTDPSKAVERQPKAHVLLTF